MREFKISVFLLMVGFFLVWALVYLSPVPPRKNLTEQIALEYARLGTLVTCDLMVAVDGVAYAVEASSNYPQFEHNVKQALGEDTCTTIEIFVIWP